MSAPKITTKYLEQIYNPKKFKITITKMVKEITKLNKTSKINAIAFTGTSGAAIAYPVSYITGIPLLCVRKSTRDNHSRMKLEGFTTPKNYVIVDDFIASGRTIKNIRRAIQKESPKSKLTHVLLYRFQRENRFDQDLKVNLVYLK